LPLAVTVFLNVLLFTRQKIQQFETLFPIVLNLEKYALLMYSDVTLQLNDATYYMLLSASRSSNNS